MMSSPMWQVAAAIAVAFAISIGLAVCSEACTPSTPTPAQQAAVAAEGLEDKACVDSAQKDVGKEALRATIDECRAKVHAKWNDGGVK